MTPTSLERALRAEQSEAVKRHYVELAYSAGTIYARCRCGWEGTHHELRAVSRAQAVRAAEREAAEHEAEQDQ